MEVRVIVFLVPFRKNTFQQQQYLRVMSMEDDRFPLPTGFAPIAKHLLQYELHTFRPFMSKPQQEVFVQRLESALMDDEEWMAMPRSERIDSHYFVTAFPPRPHKLLPCAIEMRRKQKRYFAATVDGVLNVTCNYYMQLRVHRCIRCKSENDGDLSEVDGPNEPESATIVANMSLADGLEMVDDEAGREEPEYRRLSHVEQLQLAYVRFRPIMASVVLARLLLTVGVLCLNERDLKNLLCTRLVRDCLHVAPLTETPIDNALSMPYYGLLRKCSLFESAWNDIIPLESRRKLWSDSEMLRPYRRETECIRAFNSLDAFLGTRLCRDSDEDVLAMRRRMAAWIFAGEPPRQYPFVIGLQMVSPQIIGPLPEDNIPEFMKLIVPLEKVSVHRISNGLIAKETQKRAIKDAHRQLQIRDTPPKKQRRVETLKEQLKLMNGSPHPEQSGAMTGEGYGGALLLERYHRKDDHGLQMTSSGSRMSPATPLIVELPPSDGCRITLDEDEEIDVIGFHRAVVETPGRDENQSSIRRYFPRRNIRPNYGPKSCSVNADDDQEAMGCDTGRGGANRSDFWNEAEMWSLELQGQAFDGEDECRPLDNEEGEEKENRFSQSQELILLGYNVNVDGADDDYGRYREDYDGEANCNVDNGPEATEERKPCENEADDDFYDNRGNLMDARNSHIVHRHHRREEPSVNSPRNDDDDDIRSTAAAGENWMRASDLLEMERRRQWILYGKRCVEGKFLLSASYTAGMVEHQRRCANEPSALLLPLQRRFRDHNNASASASSKTRGDLRRGLLIFYALLTWAAVAIVSAAFIYYGCTNYTEYATGSRSTAVTSTSDENGDNIFTLQLIGNGSTQAPDFKQFLRRAILNISASGGSSPRYSRIVVSSVHHRLWTAFTGAMASIPPASHKVWRFLWTVAERASCLDLFTGLGGLDARNAWEDDL